MEDEPTCPQCALGLAPGDSVVVASNGRLAHLDCRVPRALGGDERFALVCYCFDHAVADCAQCRRAYREIDLLTDYLSGRTHLCPGCRADLTESIRAHLYSCAMLPEEVRRRARAVREAARRLVKQSHQLMDRADVLTREAEATIATLRGTWRRSVFTDPDALLLVVRLRLADGRRGYSTDHFGETGRWVELRGLRPDRCAARFDDDRHDRRVTVLGRARRHPDRPSRRLLSAMESGAPPVQVQPLTRRHHRTHP